MSGTNDSKASAVGSELPVHTLPQLKGETNATSAPPFATADAAGDSLQGLAAFGAGATARRKEEVGESIISGEGGSPLTHNQV